MMDKEILEGVAHEIWAVAQLLPEEGIEDGVRRIKDLLRKNFVVDYGLGWEDVRDDIAYPNE